MIFSMSRRILNRVRYQDTPRDRLVHIARIYTTRFDMKRDPAIMRAWAELVFPGKPLQVYRETN